MKTLELPTRKYSGQGQAADTPPLPAALRCCQFLPRGAASHLETTAFRKLAHNAAVVACVCVKGQLSD